MYVAELKSPKAFGFKNTKARSPDSSKAINWSPYMLMIIKPLNS